MAAKMVMIFITILFITEQIDRADLFVNCSACAGDSGGPLVDGYSSKTLIGVVSWGKGCGLARYPGVYADVGSSRIWIKSITGI